MRQVDQRLQRTLIGRGTDLVEHQGKKNRYGEVENQLVHIDQKRVDYQLPEIAVLKKDIFEIPLAMLN